MTDVIQDYRNLKPSLERLRSDIQGALEGFLRGGDISVFSVESRLKEEGSISNKLERKQSIASLADMDDLCGVRVICYYQDDVQAICKIIEKEFAVVEREDKRDSLEDNEFGYTSVHYIVQLKTEWLSHPKSRGLGDLKAEIQVRTMLMHTWAAISHKLLYKREADVPSQFKRQLNRLSALIELADEQFDAMKNSKQDFVKSLSFSSERLKFSAELSSDSLLAVRQRYFSDRKIEDGEMPLLLDDVRIAGFDLNQLVGSIERCLPILGDLEAEEAEFFEYSLPMWSFAGVIRTVLDLTSDDYFDTRGGAYEEDDSITHRYRQLLQSRD
ncbi:putative GTP pyrophosphokinase [Pseudomonas sp. IT-P44]|uniref:GTP pyrophosphokinase n=1 Tax=Pseudomonas sp. IT-P44 TaxID=3026451 RepID=UPI0039E1E94D